MSFDARKQSFLRQMAISNHNELSTALVAVMGKLGVVGARARGGRGAHSSGLPVVEKIVTRLANSQLSSPDLEHFIEGTFFSGRYRLDVMSLPGISSLVDENLQRRYSPFQLSRFLARVTAGN